MANLEQVNTHKNNDYCRFIILENNSTHNYVPVLPILVHYAALKNYVQSKERVSLVTKRRHVPILPTFYAVSRNYKRSNKRM